MKNLLTLIFCLLVWTGFSQTKSSQRNPSLMEGTALQVGMSDARLQRIDAMCEAHIKEGKLPGIVALVAKNGRIIYHKAFGMADSPAGKPMTTDAIFRIASQSKAITSTAVMMLWEEGKFRLDDPISKYIPAFKNPKVLQSFQYRDTSYRAKPAKREITIRHLLTHTSGIGYGVIDGDERFRMIYKKAGITDLFTTEDISIEESVKKLAELPLHHDPGDGYVYSEGLDVLGYFIEVISGMSFSDFLQERLFKPLGMNDTHFYLPSEQANRLVKVQQKEEEKWVHYPVTFYDTDYPIKGAKRFYSGGAGLSSTAKDYATFLQMYLNGGELNGIRFLSRTTIETMMQNQVKDFWEGSGKHYGLAFGVVNEEGVAQGGLGSLGTFDWGGYFNTQYFADPKEKVIGILMKQTQGPVDDQTGWMFRMLVGQAIDN
ncbi:MAG: beta-lactamase family protein [Saprospiraceae bacterium]|nr:beta-lactamase family protein [Saprospiraceae bacterium]